VTMSAGARPRAQDAGRRCGALYRAVGSRGGRELDIPQALVFRFDGDELQEVLAMPGDPAAFDAF
jgi:hypothetical protein